MATSMGKIIKMRERRNDLSVKIVLYTFSLFPFMLRISGVANNYNYIPVFCKYLLKKVPINKSILSKDKTVTHAI